MGKTKLTKDECIKNSMIMVENMPKKELTEYLLKVYSMAAEMEILDVTIGDYLLIMLSNMDELYKSISGKEES